MPLAFPLISKIKRLYIHVSLLFQSFIKILGRNSKYYSLLPRSACKLSFHPLRKGMESSLYSTYVDLPYVCTTTTTNYTMQLKVAQTFRIITTKMARIPPNIHKEWKWAQAPTFQKNGRQRPFFKNPTQRRPPHTNTHTSAHKHAQTLLIKS